MRESDQASEKKKMTKIKILGQNNHPGAVKHAPHPDKTRHPRSGHKAKAETPREDQVPSVGPMVFAFQRQEAREDRGNTGSRESISQGSMEPEEQKKNFAFRFEPQPMPVAPKAPPRFIQEIGRTIALEKLAILVEEYEAGRIAKEDFIKLKARYMRALQ